MPVRRLVVLVALAVLVPGCVLGPADPAPDETVGRAALLPPEWSLKALPFGEGHDHADVTHHAGLSTPNFHVLGWDPLVTDELGASAGAYFCGETATTAEGRRLAVVNSFNTQVAFVLVDVTDPAKPQKLGEYILDKVHVYDTGLTPDGRFVVLAARPEQSRLAQPPKPGAAAPAAGDAAGLDADAALPDAWTPEVPTVTVQPRWRDACTGEVRNAGPERNLPLFPGTALISVEDPQNPTFADFKPAPVRGPHSVSTSRVGETTWVVSAQTNPHHHAAYFSFYHVGGGPRGGSLEPVTVWQALPTARTATLTNGHVDGVVHEHPVSGRTLAHLANWDGGYVILDLTDPKRPEPIATWGQDEGSIHEALPLDGLWDGRHYTLVGQEVGEPADLPSGWVYLMDTTDAASPVEVGRWTLPHKPDWDGGLQFSTHYVTVVGRTLFVSAYHGGVWAIDLSSPEKMAAPQAVGVFLPDRVSPKPPARPGDSPSTLDVLAQPDGNLVVYDAPSGVYVVHFDASDPAPPAPRWATGE